MIYSSVCPPAEGKLLEHHSTTPRMRTNKELKERDSYEGEERTGKKV